MTIKLPTLTPFEALKEFADGNQEFTKDGFTYSLDGPSMSPDEFCFPVAESKEDGCVFFPAGDLDDDITEDTEWLAG